MKENVPIYSNTLCGQFVLGIKNSRTDLELCKARFVVQERIDHEKNLLVHSFTSIKQQTVGLLVAIAAIFGF